MTPIPEKTLKLLQEQYNAERQASATYSAISNALSQTPFKGFSKHFSAEASNEATHAKKIEDYLIARNQIIQVAELGKVTYPTLWPIQAVELAAALEQQFTALINAIYAQAHTDADYNTCAFLQDFLSEQVASEYELNELLLQLKIAADNSAALLHIDSNLS